MRVCLQWVGGGRVIRSWVEGWGFWGKEGGGSIGLVGREEIEEGVVVR